MWQQPNCSSGRCDPGQSFRLQRATCSPGLKSRWGRARMASPSRRSALPTMASFLASPPTICRTSLKRTTTGEGSTALAFYNVQQGDAPYFKSLADTLHDERQLPPIRQRRHGRQPHHVRPCRHDLVQRRQRQSCRTAGKSGGIHRSHITGGPNPDQGIVNEIENPNPSRPAPTIGTRKTAMAQSGNSGYPPPYTPSPVSGGGSYSDCSDTTQPGVGRSSATLTVCQHQPPLRNRSLLPAEQLQPGLLRQRQERLHRPESGRTLRSRSRLRRRPASAMTSTPTAFPGNTTAISGTTTSPTRTS